MTAIRWGSWRFELVAPVHVHRSVPKLPVAASPSATRPAHRVYHDPTPTPGAFEPPMDLFREIARGARALE